MAPPTPDPRRRPSRRPEPGRPGLAQPVGPGRVAGLHGDGHGHGPGSRWHRHHDEHVPHADAASDVPDVYLRGLPPDVRRRHADHADLEPADHRQGRGRAVLAADDVHPGGRRVVLGRQPDPGLPAQGLLAARHHGQLHRALERGAGRAGRVRRAHPDPDVLHRRVRVCAPTGHFSGVRSAPYTLTQTFYIGASLVAIGNTATHRTQIYYNGKLRYNWPISSGRPGDDTPDGSYLTIEKANPVEMKGPGYDLWVPWSVRFTFSGDYYHDAYWSVGQQGFDNVSHGCVNLSPAHAETYYKLAVPGDPITIVGSSRAGTWDNGWTEWFLSWPRYLQGSALHEAVQAGPSGSTFVDPSSLPPSTATAPLQTALA